jgi:hypothetical protein
MERRHWHDAEKVLRWLQDRPRCNAILYLLARLPSSSISAYSISWPASVDRLPCTAPWLDSGQPVSSPPCSRRSMLQFAPSLVPD